MKFLNSLKNKNLTGKICLLRVDFNITDADLRRYQRGLTRRIPLRIESILPTIKFLTKRGAKVVILSHRGRPRSRINADKNADLRGYTLKPFAKIISQSLKKPVHFIDFKKGFNLSKISETIARGSIFLLENLRFFPGEDKNDQEFAKSLAFLGTFYINDAFAFSHRPAASMAGIPKFLPSYAGLLLEKEIKNLSRVMKKPKKPLVIILGGAKIADKIGLIENFKNKADCFLIGGAIANTFLAAQGFPVNNSLYDKKATLAARKLLKTGKIILPLDTAVFKRQILDIGVKTIEKYSKIIKNAKTIIWNGPMGYIEDKRFRKGSLAILEAILKSRAFSAIGGGETVAVFQTATRGTMRIYTQNYAEKFNVSQRQVRASPRIFISTGGGAMLEFLAGKKMPGIEALKNNKLN